MSKEHTSVMRESLVDGSTEEVTFPEVDFVALAKLDPNPMQGAITKKEQRLTLDGIEEVDIVVLPPLVKVKYPMYRGKTK